MGPEAKYQAYLIRKLEQTFPDCFIIKTDPATNQGVPDLLILCDDKWAMLEVKASSSSPIQPNQEYYVDFFDGMGYAAFIFPEIEEVVFDDLQQTFGSEW